MLIYLSQEGLQDPDEALTEGEEDDADEGDDGPLMCYLKSIAPPAIDAEMRSICLHDSDEEGIEHLTTLLVWFARELQRGRNFEVLQAYLNRLLVVYAEVLLKLPVCREALLRLLKVHEESSARFRELIQRNLCLLKVLARLPIL